MTSRFRVVMLRQADLHDGTARSDECCSGRRIKGDEKGSQLLPQLGIPMMMRRRMITSRCCSNRCRDRVCDCDVQGLVNIEFSSVVDTFE